MFPTRPSTNEGNTFGYDTACMVASSCTLIWLRPLFKVKGRSSSTCTQGAATHCRKPFLTYQANCLVSRFPLGAKHMSTGFMFRLGVFPDLIFTRLAVLTLQVILHLSQLWFNSFTSLMTQPWDHTIAVRMSTITNTCAAAFRERSQIQNKSLFSKNKKGCGARD